MRKASLILIGLFAWTRAVHFTGAAFDLGTTLKANQYTQEMNPVMGQKPIQQVSVMTSSAFAVDHITSTLHTTHPKLASGLNIAAGLMHFTAGSWNIHVIRQVGH